MTVEKEKNLILICDCRTFERVEKSKTIPQVVVCPSCGTKLWHRKKLDDIERNRHVYKE
jgi:hypothetical protein